MKIDRFVKVMLVLIVVFLALNFFNNFNNSFNSQGDRFRFENIAEAQVANRANKPAANASVSASRTQYKAVYGPDTMYSADKLQIVLDQQSIQSWEYVGTFGNALIFKK